MLIATLTESLPWLIVLALATVLALAGDAWLVWAIFKVGGVWAKLGFGVGFVAVTAAGTIAGWLFLFILAVSDCDPSMGDCL